MYFTTYIVCPQTWLDYIMLSLTIYSWETYIGYNIAMEDKRLTIQYKTLTL